MRAHRRRTPLQGAPTRVEHLSPEPPARAEPAAPAEQPADAWEVAQRAIAEAARFTEAGSSLPPMHATHGVRRLLAVPVARLILRAAQLFLRDQRSFNVETIAALRALAEAFVATVRGVEARLVADGARTSAEAEARSEARQAALLDRLDALERALTETASAADQRAAAVEQRLGAAQHEAIARLEDAIRQVTEENQRLRTQFLLHDRGLATLMDRVPVAPAQAGTSKEDEELDHLLDAFYVSFEDKFRGARDTIKERVAVYLPLVREAGAGTPERPVLDLGAGRGEWLEVLAEAGLQASGVDLNRAMVDEDRRRGLAVTEGDALRHLRSLPDASCGAVTAMHLVEHVPFPVLIRMIDEIVRVLCPGGVVILETPNPQNFLVGASAFYLDPTHRNPLHPATMAFLAESRGLARVEIRYLHPVDDSHRLPDDGSPVTARLNDYFYGPQDFALIAYRP